jgi:homoserine kinase type II
MAVYTEVSRDVLATFLDDYNLGDVLVFQEILEGIENSNFFLKTSFGRYVLTIFEKRAAEQDLPYFLGIMEYLADKNFPSPKPIKNFNGVTLGKILGKPAAIVTFLDGKCTNTPSLEDFKAAGTALADLHITATDFPMQRSNNLGLNSWRPLFQKSARSFRKKLAA